MRLVLASTLLIRTILAAPPVLIECGSATDSMFSGGVSFTILAGPMASKTVRSGQTFTYKIPAPDGEPQAITFGVAEPCGPGAGCSLPVTGPGQRVFSVTVNGQPLLPRLDIFAEAGLQKSKAWTFTVFPSDGTITVTLAGISRTAVLSSIAVTPLAPPQEIPQAGPGITITQNPYTITFNSNVLANAYAALQASNTFGAGQLFMATEDLPPIRLMCGAPPLKLLPWSLYCTLDGKVWVFDGAVSRRILTEP